MAEKKAKPSKLKLIEEKLINFGNFSKDASGPLGIEERLNIANRSVNILMECILELAKGE